MSKQSQYHSRWKQFKMSASERRHRRFSKSFKRAKVAEIARGVTKICEVVKQYEVSSTSVYRWLDKFGHTREKKESMIVDTGCNCPLERGWGGLFEGIFPLV